MKLMKEHVMMHKSGFTLLNLLMYLLVFTLLASLVCAWAMRTQSSLKKESAAIMHIINDYGALDVLMRDLKQSPADRSLWERTGSHEIIWSHDNEYIGWSFEQLELVRWQGKRLNGRWVDFTKSLIHEKVTNCSFACIMRKGEDTEYEKIIITLNDTKCTIALRNGLIDE